MTVRELLPFIPRYSDNSGYDVKVNFKTGGKNWRHCGHIILPDENEIEKCLFYPFNSVNEIYDSEIERITPGRIIAGGHYDESLQLWLKTERFVRNT